MRDLGGQVVYVRGVEVGGNVLGKGTQPSTQPTSDSFNVVQILNQPHVKQRIKIAAISTLPFKYLKIRIRTFKVQYMFYTYQAGLAVDMRIYLFLIK